MYTHYSAVFVGCASALGWDARSVVIDHHCIAEIWSRSMVFDHYTPAQSQGRSSDGLLWTRLALSRNGVDFSYVSRAPYVERGLGR